MSSVVWIGLVSLVLLVTASACSGSGEDAKEAGGVPEKPWDYLRVDLPSNLDGRARIILRYTRETSAKFETVGMAQVHGFDLEVGASTEIEGYTFELLGVDADQGAWVRATLPDGRVKGS